MLSHVSEFSFIFKAYTPLYVYITFLFIRVSVDEHLDCFHFWLLWIVLLWSLLWTEISVWVIVFSSFEYDPWSGCARSHGNSVFLIFWRSTKLSYTSGFAILYSHQQWTRVPVSPYPFPYLLFSHFFLNHCHPNACEVISHGSLIFIS